MKRGRWVNRDVTTDPPMHINSDQSKMTNGPGDLIRIKEASTGIQAVIFRGRVACGIYGHSRALPQPAQLCTLLQKK